MGTHHKPTTVATGAFRLLARRAEAIGHGSLAAHCQIGECALAEIGCVLRGAERRALELVMVAEEAAADGVFSPTELQQITRLSDELATSCREEIPLS